jgi:hypothetical protein
MKGVRSRPLLLLAGLVVIVGLPLAGKWVRRQPEPRCALNGLKVEPLYGVRVVDRAGGSLRFCCVRCARRWLARQGGSPEAVYVTDETGGEEIDSRSATFVQSPVATNPITGNRVHAFRDRAAAEEHIRAFGGWVLTGADRPFQVAPGLAAGVRSR